MLSFAPLLVRTETPHDVFAAPLILSLVALACMHLLMPFLLGPYAHFRPFLSLLSAVLSFSPASLRLPPCHDSSFLAPPTKTTINATRHHANHILHFLKR
jgi:hypothetical protein